jgi:AraC-like DNA-binding protein
MGPQRQMGVTSTSFASSERFDYWADVVTQKFVPLECDTSDRRNFYGEIRHRQIGLIGIADVKASEMRARRTRSTIARAPSNDLIVVLHMHGTCHAAQSSEAAKLLPGEGAMVVTDERYLFEFPGRFRQLVLKLPKDLLAQEGVQESGGLSLSLAAAPVRLLERLALATLEDPAQFSAEEEIGIERAFAELLRAASASINVGRSSKAYSRARLLIRRHLADPKFKPVTLASELKMSQRNLSRLFALHGMTIERAIWMERLVAAQRDLLDPRLAAESITNIAISWAFCDAAHFSRSFRKTFGLSPKSYRLIHLRKSVDQRTD